MKTKLLSNLTPEDEAELRQNFVYSLVLRKRLIEVLESEIDSHHASMRKEENFDKPNWALIQADRIAQVKALKRVISLLE